jgi:hypothetical protein
VRTYDEHRHPAVSEECFGNTAVQQVPESRPAVSGQYDAVGIKLFDRGHDFMEGVAAGNRGPDRNSASKACGDSGNVGLRLLDGIKRFYLPIQATGDWHGRGSDEHQFALRGGYMSLPTKVGTTTRRGLVQSHAPSACSKR